MATGIDNVLEADFLKAVSGEKNVLTLFLVNGVKLTGVIADFDKNSLLLQRDGRCQLVYKHAISTIMPGANFAYSRDG